MLAHCCGLRHISVSGSVLRARVTMRMTAGGGCGQSAAGRRHSSFANGFWPIAALFLFICCFLLLFFVFLYHSERAWNVIILRCLTCFGFAERIKAWLTGSPVVTKGLPMENITVRKHLAEKHAENYPRAGHLPVGQVRSTMRRSGYARVIGQDVLYDSKTYAYSQHLGK